jgi:hypothetical protein
VLIYGVKVKNGGEIKIEKTAYNIIEKHQGEVMTNDEH